MSVGRLNYRSSTFFRRPPSMKMMTIGYEGLGIAEFFAELLTHRVATLVDVRELPLSRKKGFSKSALSENATRHRIEYVHIPELGCPREVRKDYYVDSNWGRYKKRFNTYLRKQDTALVALLERAQRETCCLLCFEADYRECHRTLIVDALLAKRAIVVRHLRVTTAVPIAGPALAFA